VDSKLLALAAVGGAYWYLKGRKQRNPKPMRRQYPVSKRAPTLMQARLSEGANRIKEDRVLAEWERAERNYGSSSPQAQRLRDRWYQLQKLDYDKNSATITAHQAYRKRYGKYPQSMPYP
jgi:hypothetical protein